VSLDEGTGVYSMHPVFRPLLERLFGEMEEGLRNQILRRCGDWFAEHDEFAEAVRMYSRGDDFDKALTVMEGDLSENLVMGQVTFFAEMFEQCPEVILSKHPGAAFKRALAALATTDLRTFSLCCQKMALLFKDMPPEDPATKGWLGELELLMALTEYNDIAAMSARHRKAWELMERPTGVYAAHSTWSMGCPSALYMFHRKPGGLEDEAELMRTCMPIYYRVTAGHGAGAEKIFEAEVLYNAGKFSEASVACHMGEILASERSQAGNVLIAHFLRMRIAMARRRLNEARDSLSRLKAIGAETQDRFLADSAEVCSAWFAAATARGDLIPAWMGAGADPARDNRLLAFARGYWFTVHGMALLLDGRFERAAGLFKSLLEEGRFANHKMFDINAGIIISAACLGMGDRAGAVKELRAALDLALPDRLLMPFVEASRHILPVLKELRNDRRGEDVKRIIELAQLWPEGDLGAYGLSGRGLSPSQEMLLSRLRAGTTFKELAFELNLTYGTIRNRFVKMYRLFGVDNLKGLLAKIQASDV
jgi:LuxR family maltose regulon positive regulatory protein